ncbi:MAG: head GIN domain-containing protein [Bacteroidota bacterium]
MLYRLASKGAAGHGLEFFGVTADMVQRFSCFLYAVQIVYYYDDGPLMESLTMENTSTRLLGEVLVMMVAMFHVGWRFGSWPGRGMAGSGNIISQIRPMRPFHGVRIDGVGKVFVRQESDHSVRIEADDNIIEHVKASVSRGILAVGLRKSCSSATVNIHVSMKDVRLLEVSGAGEVVTESPIRTTTLKCRIDGTGSVKLAGTAEHADIAVKGSGWVHCFDLIASTCSVEVSGMGSCKVHASRKIDATLSGMGEIVYGGNPESVSRNVSGMGRITSR